MSPIGADDARRMVSEVLSGAVTEESHPWVFDEDVLFFAVGRVEAADPAWLLARLADRSVPFDRRCTVFGDTIDVRAAALLLLEAERPGFLFEL